MNLIARNILFCGTILFAACPYANAGFITAVGWVTTEANSRNATPSTLDAADCSRGTAACTLANADVTFTTDGLNFSTVESTIAAWLSSSAFPLDNLVDNAPGAPMDPTIWEFTGDASFTSPDAFTIAHDDGVTFTVDGQNVVNDSGPSSGATTGGTYTGPAGGALPFQLIYGECCGFSAILQTDLVGPANAPVPEPATGLLMVAALLIAPLTRRVHLGRPGAPSRR